MSETVAELVHNLVHDVTPSRDQWQPIETAPIEFGKAAEAMILYCPGVTSWNRYHNASDILVGVWTGAVWHSDVGDVDQGYESTGAYFEREALRPTHWMTLPSPPENTK